MKTYIQPELHVMHIELPRTIDVSGGDDFWGGNDSSDGDDSSPQ